MSENTPVILFKGYRILNIDYQGFESKNEYDKKLRDTELNVKMAPALSEEQDHGRVQVKVSFANNKKKQVGTIKVYGYFDFKKGLSLEQKKQYLAVNGSAMLYPYVRTMVSVITSLDDENVTVLPAINFVEAYEKGNQS